MRKVSVLLAMGTCVAGAGLYLVGAGGVTALPGIGDSAEVYPVPDPPSEGQVSANAPLAEPGVLAEEDRELVASVLQEHWLRSELRLDDLAYSADFGHRNDELITVYLQFDVPQNLDSVELPYRHNSETTTSELPEPVRPPCAPTNRVGSDVDETRTNGFYLRSLTVLVLVIDSGTKCVLYGFPAPPGVPGSGNKFYNPSDFESGFVAGREPKEG